MSRAVDIAYEILESAIPGMDHDVDALLAAAQLWNGAGTRQPGSQYGYVDVLTEAYDIANRTVGSLRS